MATSTPPGTGLIGLQSRAKRPVTVLAGPARSSVPSHPGHRPHRRLGHQLRVRHRLELGRRTRGAGQGVVLDDRHRHHRRDRGSCSACSTCSPSSRTRAFRTALIHMVLNLTVVVLFAVSFAIRRDHLDEGDVTAATSSSRPWRWRSWACRAGWAASSPADTASRRRRDDPSRRLPLTPARLLQLQAWRTSSGFRVSPPWLRQERRRHLGPHAGAPLDAACTLAGRNLTGSSGTPTWPASAKIGRPAPTSRRPGARATSVSGSERG